MTQTALEIAKDNYQAALLDDKAARIRQGMSNEYDVVDSKNEKHRRKAKTEIKNETEMLGDLKRYKAINLGRNLQRNFSTVGSHFRQFRLNVVGAQGPKLSLLTTDKDANVMANDWFNSVWAKDPDAKDDTPLNELTANALITVKREGDFIVAFDDFDADDGKLLFWEADQLTGISDSDWKRQKQFPASQKFTQSNGVIRDRRGVVRGWIVSNGRGKAITAVKEVTILKRDRGVMDPGVAKMVKSPWRLNQYRGTAEVLAAAADYQDAYEILSKELQSAKVAASFAGIVTKKDGQGAEVQLSEGGTDLDQEIEDATDESVVTGKSDDNYDRLETLTGGYMEYMEDGEDFKILDHARPNIQLQEFLNHTLPNAGASMGLSKTYATLTPAGSYTAFRGDMLLAWSQFYWDQKFLERRFIDWIVTKALAWAQRKRMIRRLPAGWETKQKINWPKMPQTDPLKAALAIKQELANGTTDYEEQLGPMWREKLQALSEQLTFAAGLGLLLNREVTESDEETINDVIKAGDEEDEKNLNQ